jgi:hypothetical protein
MIVWLASYPRSGNTFYRILLYHLYGLKTYGRRNDETINKMGAKDVVGHELLPAPLPELSKSKDVYIVKTHRLPEDDSPAIYIMRDGRDALVSYARFRVAKHATKVGIPDKVMKMVGLKSRFERALKQLIVNKRYGGWNDHVLNWTLKRKNAKTFHLKFEDLVKDPGPWISKGLEALKIDAAPVGGSIPSFEELHRKWPDYFRKGKVGSWREEMSPEMQALFWKHNAEAMDAFGYRRD